jgi:hypothetical protein
MLGKYHECELATRSASYFFQKSRLGAFPHSCQNLRGRNLGVSLRQNLHLQRRNLDDWLEQLNQLANFRV